jgi:hypothetical protein
MARLPGDLDCRNHEICSGWVPEPCRRELCFECLINFGDWESTKGILELKNDEFCCICLDTTRCVKFTQCDHYICINDFKRCFYGEPRVDPPLFPYPELRNDYNLNKTRYKNDPVIIKYHKDYQTWENHYDTKFSSEEHIRRCPLCRVDILDWKRVIQ